MGVSTDKTGSAAVADDAHIVNRNAQQQLADKIFTGCTSGSSFQCSGSHERHLFLQEFPLSLDQLTHSHQLNCLRASYPPKNADANRVSASYENRGMPSTALPGACLLNGREE